MALCMIQGALGKFGKFAFAKNNTILISTSLKFKQYSTANQKESKNEDIVKSVFISQSNDIFTNLALEDWFYRNFDFSNQHILLLWRNAPCVVIGRHQNPWLEANTCELGEHGIEIARRNSGGGTVYHDAGNLNLTFFTPRDKYDRKHNLEIINRALYREWGLKTEITPREDIIVNGQYKQISGTAAKLGRPNAYHHCTLMVDVNKLNLSLALHKHHKGIKTNATQSVPAPVMNLIEVNSHVRVEKLLGAVGWEYLRTCPHTLQDGGHQRIAKQRGFQLINPTDNWFPGLEAVRKEFASWDWRFGKSPKFTVTRQFAVPQEIVGEGDIGGDLTITVEVERGEVQDVVLTVPPGLTRCGFHGEAQVVTSLRGQRFSEEAILALQKSLSHEVSNEFVVDCVRQVVRSA